MLGTSARFDQCPRCKNWHSCERVRENPAATAPADELRTLDTYEAHDPPRVAIHPDWDRALDAPRGSGLAIGSHLALWSKPGSGKTTEALRLCAARGGVFLESEFQNLGMLRMFADRAGIDASRVVPQYVEQPRDAIAIIKARTWPIAVVDSLNALCGASAPRSYVKETLDRLRNAASARGTTLIVILQVTKSGSANAPTWVEHMVDTTVSLSRSAIVVTKNRFGERCRIKRSPRAALRVVA